MELGEVRTKLNEFVPTIIEEFIAAYENQPDGDFCRHPEKTAALCEQLLSFAERFNLVKYVALAKETANPPSRIRNISREFEVQTDFMRAAEENGFCWKIGRDIARYTILKASAYQMARRVGVADSPENFSYEFTLEDYYNFFGKPGVFQFRFGK